PCRTFEGVRKSFTAKPRGSVELRAFVEKNCRNAAQIRELSEHRTLPRSRRRCLGRDSASFRDEFFKTRVERRNAQEAYDVDGRACAADGLCVRADVGAAEGGAVAVRDGPKGPSDYAADR